MAQLKVKQISDFVSAVTGIHNGTVGTAAGSAIGDAKSEAISTAVSADVVVKSEAISAAVSADVVVKSQAISTAFSADVVAKSEAISAAVSADVVVLSSAKKYTDDEVVKVNAKITTEKERIDAILEASEADKDSFAEIVELINSVDLTNDNALGTAVLSLATVDTGLASRISDLENSSANGDDLNALEARVTTNEGDIAGNARDISDLAGRVSTNETNITNIVDIDITNINTTLNNFGDIVSYDYSDVTTDIETAYNNAVTESTRLGDLAYDAAGSADTAELNANHYTDGLINALGTAAYNATGDFDAAGSADDALVAAKAYADTAEADAIASANGYTDDEIAALDTTLRGLIDGVAGTDKAEQIATVSSETEFSVAQGLSLDNNDILVFINGLQIHNDASGDGFRTLNGRDFTVNLPYPIDENDHIVVIGVLA